MKAFVTLTTTDWAGVVETNKGYFGYVYEGSDPESGPSENDFCPALLDTGDNAYTGTKEELEARITDAFDDNGWDPNYSLKIDYMN